MLAKFIATLVLCPYLSLGSGYLSICSFNIQFLGLSKTRNNEWLADLVSQYDVVVVQELIAPPYEGKYPDGEAYVPDPDSASFFDAMNKRDFLFWLSEEDTGPGKKNHNNGASTEWWVTFYKPDKVRKALDLPYGFLDPDRTANPDYDRVPYAFSFRSMDDSVDFVLISVHLRPGLYSKNAARRKHELSAIERWTRIAVTQERDFIVLGDCNISDKQDLKKVTPEGFRSLNDACVSTNTNSNSPRPYDHVFYTASTAELDHIFGFCVIDLQALLPVLKSNIPFVGEMYEHTRFRTVYSDHNPIVFRLKTGGIDDD